MSGFRSFRGVFRAFHRSGGTLGIAKTSITVALLAMLAPAAWAQYNIIGKDYTLRTGTTSASLVERMRVTQGGLTGIGLADPSYTLDVSGTVRATQFRGDGSLLINLPYPSGTTIISGTTTMVNGWPDAISCSGTAGTMLLHKNYITSANIHSYYFISDPTSSVSYYVSFNSDGSANTYAQSSVFLTSCVSKSISQLYASGQAFNFIGNSGVGGALGDRLTSGTLAVTANSATNVVSLSTAGTTWGYFGSNASYLPNLNAGAISTINISISTINGISATNFGGTPVAFRVHRNEVNQTVTDGAIVNLDWTTEMFDTNNNFDLSTDRFTPTVPGKYLISLNAYCQPSSGYCTTGIRKNGSLYAQGHGYGVNQFAPVTAVVDMNGTTDYLTADVANGGGTAIRGDRYSTFFQGALINAVGGSGGTTSAAGSTGQIQYNTGSSFDASAGLTWDNANQRLIATTISTTGVSSTGLTLTGAAVVSASVNVGGTFSNRGFATLMAGSVANSGYTDYGTAAGVSVGYVGWGNTSLDISGRSGYPIRLMPSSTLAMTLAPTGYVGINTPSPAASLHVKTATSLQATTITLWQVCLPVAGIAYS